MLREMKKKKPEPVVVAAPQMAMNLSGMDDAQKLDFLKAELREVLAMIRQLNGAEAEAGEAAAKKAMKGKG